MSDRVLAVVGRGVVDITTPILRGDDLGVTRGDGVFETVRVGNARPFLFDEHFRRMQVGAARLELDLPSAADWLALLTEALPAYGDSTGVLRLFTTRGPEGLDAPTSYLTISPVPAVTLAGARDGTHAVTLAFGVPAGLRAEAPWLLGGIKTSSYAVAMAAKREAAARGAHDAIWISGDGEVLEEATSSVVWIRGGAAYTIPAEVGILAGTTLECVRALAAAGGVPITDRRTTLAELRAADEILLLSAVRGVAAVLTLDAQPIGSGRRGPIGLQLGAAFEDAFTASTA